MYTHTHTHTHTHARTHTHTHTFTVMSYNVLCDKYATRQMYGYCPSWALVWDYRKQSILKEILDSTADIITLQVSVLSLGLAVLSVYKTV